SLRVATTPSASVSRLTSTAPSPCGGRVADPTTICTSAAAVPAPPPTATAASTDATARGVAASALKLDTAAKVRAKNAAAVFAPVDACRAQRPLRRIISSPASFADAETYDLGGRSQVERLPITGHGHPPRARPT